MNSALPPTRNDRGVFSPTAPALTRAPILLADDDPDDLFFTLRSIKRTGTKHPVTTFDDGSGVVDFLTRAWLSHDREQYLFPKLLFLDLKMAGLGGLRFLEWVRQHKELAALNIIVLSGSEDPTDVDRAMQLGAKRYLTKYPSVATFTTIVRSIYPENIAAAPS
jgi:CheY-like chemotaxis protein